MTASGGTDKPTGSPQDPNAPSTLPSPRRPGPKTREGKARVRFNAVRHALSAHQPVVPGLESVPEWEAYRTALWRALAPEGALEDVLAERVIETAWRLRRVSRYERAVIAEQVDERTAGEGQAWLLPDQGEAQHIQRYEAHLSRQFYQALHELEAQQARRRGQTAPLARVEVHGVSEG